MLRFCCSSLYFGRAHGGAPGEHKEVETQEWNSEGEPQRSAGEGTQGMEEHGPADAACRDLELHQRLNDSSERREGTTEVIEGVEGGMRPD